MPGKAKKPIQVETLTRNAATRPNIPTAKFGALMKQGLIRMTL